MWKNLLHRLRQTGRALRKRSPHHFVYLLDDEQFGCFNEETREILDGFAIGEEDIVVDVGCGEGTASAFAARCGAAVYAVDIDPDAIAHVERRVRDLPRKRPFQALVSDSNPLPLEDGLATRVLAREVLEHVDDPARFMAELVRIGKPGAHYLLSVPDPSSESVHKVLAPVQYWRKPNHLRVFERESFDDLVRAAGLTIEKQVNYSFFWAMWWILYWSDRGEFGAGAPGTPVLENWNKTWAALLRAPNGHRVKKALDNFMPKSRIVIARKAA